MTFKTTLFKAIDAAEIVVVNGFVVEDNYTEAGGLRQLDLADETQVHVRDADVEIDDDGECTVMLVEHDGSEWKDDDVALFSFKVERPLCEGDLE